MAKYSVSIGLLLVVAAFASNKTSSAGYDSQVEAAKKQAGSYQAGATKQYAGAYQKYMSSGGQGGGSNLPKYAGGFVNKYASGFKKYMNGKGQANGVGGSTQPGASSYGPAGYDKYYKKFMGGSGTDKNGGSAGPGASSYSPGGYDHYYKQYMGGSSSQGGGAGGGSSGPGGYDHYYKQYMGGSSGAGAGAGSSSSGAGGYDHYYKQYMGGSSGASGSAGSGGYDHYYKQYMGMGGGAAASDKADKDTSSSGADKASPQKGSQTKQAPPKSTELRESHQKLRKQSEQKTHLLQEQLAASVVTRSQSTSWSLAAAVGLVLTSVSAVGFFRLHRQRRSSEDSSQYFYLQA